MTGKGPSNEPAELAHVAATALRGGSTGVSFAIIHLADEPWALPTSLTALTGAISDAGPEAVSSALPQEWAETLSSAAYGSGVLVFAGRSRVFDHRLTTEPVAGSELDLGDLQGMRGTSLPNPGFLSDSARYAEALITLDPRGRALDLGDALVLTETIREIARLATEEPRRAPILFLQSPVSPSMEMNAQRRGDGTMERWRRADGFAVRFSVGLSQTAPVHRMRLNRQLADFAEDRGFGLQIGDRRIGRRGGEWFRVLRPDPERFDAYKLDRFPTHVTESPTRAIPITIVGPARVGSTWACASIIEWSLMGCLAASITSLGDLSFIHFLLPVAPARAGTPTGVEVRKARQALEGLCSQCSLTTQRLLAKSQRLVPVKVVEDWFSRAADYKAITGPMIDVRPSTQVHRRALWAGWEVPYRVNALSMVVTALRTALTEHSGPAGVGAASIEYMVCRRVDEDLLRGRCKISVDDTVEGAVGEDADNLTKICRRIESTWRDSLRLAGLGPAVEVELAWRERWLGRWATSLGRGRRA